MLEEADGRGGGGRGERLFLPVVSAESEVCGGEHGHGEGTAEEKMGGGGTGDSEAEGMGQQGEAGVEKEEGLRRESGVEPEGQGLTAGVFLEVFRPGSVIPSPCALDNLRLFH